MRRALPATIRTTVELLARTWRWSVAGTRHPAAVRAAGVPLLFAPWHAGLMPLVWLHRHEGITLLVSDHGDGGLLAGVAERWGYAVIRGSSTRGGARGLRALVRALGVHGTAGVTPDGPRGPAGIVKPGVIAAARRASALIVPVAVDARPAWHLRSWDRMLVPAPFARVRVLYGDALKVEEPIEPARRRLERRLHRLTAEIAA